MKKVLAIGLVLISSMVFSIGQKGAIVRVKEQTFITMNATATQVTRNIDGYVSLLADSSFVANFAGTTNSQLMAPIPSGITDTDWYFKTDDAIYVTGNGVLHVIVYDFDYVF